MIRTATIAGLLVILTMGAGCRSGSGPSVSGVGLLFGTRVVKAGETVTIKLPANESTGALEWEVTSYDSLRLGLTDRPRVERDGSDAVLVIQFRAKAPGETEVVLRKRSTGETQTYKFQITR